MPKNPSVAKDGTKLRSKGELLWYTALKSAGLKFRVEPSIKLYDDEGVSHYFAPDFVVKCKDNSLIFIDHLGLLDDEGYAERFKNKVVDYLKCGYTIGDNLIITSNNINGGISELMISEAIEKIKKRVDKY